MRTYIQAILLLVLPINAHLAADDLYPYRPYAKFYEKGKEKLRVNEYLKHKDSAVSKKYYSLFSSNKYDKVTIYQISSYHRINNKITINKMKFHASFNNDDPTYKRFVHFFRKAFPEKVRRTPNGNNMSQILVFSGKKGNCVLYIPGILGPEFALVEGANDGVKKDNTYDISNFGMSATPPFKYFWEMYTAWCK